MRDPHVRQSSRQASPSAGASWTLRLRVYTTRASLDRQIVSLRRPPPTPSLALRGLQLTHPRTRLKIARDLRRIVACVDRGATRPDLTAAVIAPDAVIAGREAILGLAERLEGTDPVRPGGVALARMLAVDGFTSPLLDRHSECSVTEAVWEAADALAVESPVIARVPPWSTTSWGRGTPSASKRS